MKRKIIILFIAILTFVLGVIAVSVWFNSQRPPQIELTVDSQYNPENKLVINPDLARNRRLWQNSKIVDYNFEIMKNFSNWMPSLIKVRNGRVISKQPIGDQGPMDTIEEYKEFETVEKAFDSIQFFFEKGYRVEVKYNEQFGYPESILFDHQRSTDSVSVFLINKLKIVKN
jgi:hypothetical protein